MKRHTNFIRNVRSITLAALALALTLDSLPQAAARPTRLRPQHATDGDVVARGEDRPIEKALRRFDLVRLDPAAAVEQLLSTGVLSIATGDGAFDLELEPHDLRAPDFRALETLEDGTTRTLPFAPVRTFKGTVKGVDGAQARFTIDGESVEGMIITPEETYYVEPMRDFSKAADGSELVVFRSSDVIDAGEGGCGTPLIEENQDAEQFVGQKNPTATTGANTRQIRLATDADNEYVAALGSSAAANAEILDILNRIEGVYEVELNLSITVVMQHTWGVTGDPYTATDAGKLLAQLRATWTQDSELRFVLRNLVHLWTGRNLDDTTVGIAFIGVMCDPSLGYGLSQRFTEGDPQKVNLTAHEIGHNLGAGHTHAIGTTAPAGCETTIMNPSVSAGLSFCDSSRMAILNHVLACASHLGLECKTANIPAGHWKGEYFNNESTSGTPVMVRDDGAANLDFDFGFGSPSDGAGCGVNADRFSVRWSRTLLLRSGTYQFKMTTDDGFRLLIDGDEKAEDTTTHLAQTKTVSVTLGGGVHTIQFTYFDDFGPAVARLSWRKTNGGCDPRISLSHWVGAYFNNENLSGNPVMIRDEGNGDLSFDFGFNSPSASCGVNTDHFSARWTRKAFFKAGDVTFKVEADDGVRLFVDGDLVIDEFHTVFLAPQTHTVTVRLTQGAHDVRMEYFDRDFGAVAKLSW